ncbi:MAG TPA: thiol reductant ABC exporter subunit CydC [Acidisphaera sp.]|nr:thiol reductant ABC exporter subunit CydC [Acidisphaera sp.]
MKPLLRILGLWRGRAAALLFGLVLSLAALATGVALMAESGRMLAGAALGGGAAMAAAGIALRFLGPSRVVLRYAERIATHDATFRALADLRVWFFRNLARSAAGGLGFRRAGDVLARLVNDVEALDGLYLRILVPLAGAVMLTVALAMLLGLRDPLLAAGVTGLFAAAAFALPLIAYRLAARTGGRVAPATAALRVAALDALTGLKEVRAYAADGRMLATLQARDAALLSLQRALATRTALAGAVAFLLGQAAIALLLLRAAEAPGWVVMMVFLLLAAFESVAALPRAGALAGHAAEAARRVLAAADTPAPVPDPASPAPIPAGTGLRFEAVRFGWRPDAPVFDGLTLDIPAGSRVAVLGPSGAGKSTLAALVLKLAAPQAGRITLGGTDLADLSADEVRSRVGWLSQATHLFDDTVRHNLLLAKPDADDAALWDALDRARVADVVRSLPEGLDAWLGEAGAHVSGGQGRRIALARTLLSPAPILILDEPAAGLDAETERAFHATLNDTLAGRTVILIAHRLTGVERLDRIYRLSAGKAVAAAG